MAEAVPKLDAVLVALAEAVQDAGWQAIVSYWPDFELADTAELQVTVMPAAVVGGAEVSVATTPEARGVRQWTYPVVVAVQQRVGHPPGDYIPAALATAEQIAAACYLQRVDGGTAKVTETLIDPYYSARAVEELNQVLSLVRLSIEYHEVVT